jgi:GntR family transcriptional regulator, phosphonate transport system regulatory protein
VIEAPVPRWRSIERALIDDVSAHRFAPGERLPGEFELAEQFGVHRHTIRRVIASLADRGVVRVEHGVGTFINEGPIFDYAIGRQTRFRKNLVSADRLPTREVVDHAVRKASPSIARALQLRAGTNIWDLRTRGFADGEPISIGSIYLSHKRFPAAASVLLAGGGVSEALRSGGVIDFSRRSTRVNARLPTTEEATLLKQPSALPVLVTESIDVCQDGLPVTLAVVAFAATRIQFTIDS